MKRLVLVALAILGTSSVQAQFSSGTELQTACSEAEGRAAWCAGYISGVADAQVALQGINVCIAEGTTAEELVQAVLVYFLDHPEQLDVTASYSVLAGLERAFPCPPA